MDVMWWLSSALGLVLGGWLGSVLGILASLRSFPDAILFIPVGAVIGAVVGLEVAQMLYSG